MEGWIQSALGAVKWIVGLLGAGWFVKKLEDRVKRKRMRRQLYEEMCGVYEALVNRISIATSIEGLKQGVVFRFSDNISFSFRAWEFYTSAEQKEFFYSLDDAVAIQEFFDSCMNIAKPVDEKKYDAELYRMQLAKRAAAVFDELVLKGRFSVQLLEEVADTSLWQYIRDLIDGERETWKKSLPL
jgi:hypothetical protein